MYMTISISTGLYPNLDLWNANKLQLQLQLTLKITDHKSSLGADFGAPSHHACLYSKFDSHGQEFKLQPYVTDSAAFEYCI